VGTRISKRVGATAVFALAALISSPAAAVSPATQATATAKIFKPLTITATQSLDFGVVVLSGASFTNEKVVMATSGAITTCGTGAGNLTCSGTPKAAIYHLVGTATANVQFLSPGFNLSNGAATLPFVPSSTSQVLQLSAGGTLDVSLGGTVSGLSNTTPDGVYSGTFAVTADYQ
jgi:Mat/Ecp fimbriae major subunit